MSHYLRGRQAAVVFVAFAFAYFLSAAIRAVTATLAPTLAREFTLNAGDLGLLAGGYFLGFALTQLPLGAWLDRFGPRRVALGFLTVAVAGCLAFATAGSFAWLLLARVLCGVGLSACLMAPLTGYRRWFDPAVQLRANSWMLMTGSLGMVAATLPVQWLLPLVGWRALFLGLAVLVVLAMAGIAWRVPPWQAHAPAASAHPPASYREVWTHPYFQRHLLMAVFLYGGMVSVQTLWVVPWMTRVSGFTPLQAATGLFGINLGMLLTFWSWGMALPRLTRAGWTPDRIMSTATPLSFVVLTLILLAADRLGAATPLFWALYCMSCTCVTLAQPVMAMVFPPHLAGRAMSAYNLLVFAGVFVVQWGIGLLIDAARARGADDLLAFRVAFSVFGALGVLSYAVYRRGARHPLARGLPGDNGSP